MHNVLRDLGQSLRQQAIQPNIYGYVPHEKQAAFHQNADKDRLFIGGNRSGKTVGGAAEAIWWCTNTHPYIDTPPPPVRGRCVGVDFVEGIEKIVKPEIHRWVPEDQLKGGSWDSAYSKRLRTLTFANGSTLEFMSYDQDLDKFAGTSRHFVWFDEEPPKNIFQECKARLVDTNGKWWITMTPVEGMTWVYYDLYESRESNPYLFTVEVDMGENPHLSEEARSKFLGGLDEQQAKIRGRGQFVAITGLIYPNFDDLNIVRHRLPPRGWTLINAMDHGLNNPTAWLFGALNDKGQLYIYDEYYQAEKTIPYHAAIVREREKEYGEPIYRVGDPSIRNRLPNSGSSIQMEYIEQGLPIALGNNDLEAGLNRVRRLIGGNYDLANPDLIAPRKIFVSEKCQTLIKELRNYRWEDWHNKKLKEERNKKEKPLQKDDHTCDTLRYMVMSRPEFEEDAPIKLNMSHRGHPRATQDREIVRDWMEKSKKDKRLDYNLGEYW